MTVHVDGQHWVGVVAALNEVEGADGMDGDAETAPICQPGFGGIAFAPNGHLFLTDGYCNARLLEYTAHGTVYVADRENSRIQIFTADGQVRGEIDHVGRVYALALQGGFLWASVGDPARQPGSGDVWILRLDPATGHLLGHLNVDTDKAGHGLAVTATGKPIITAGDGLLWFKPRE